MQTGDTVLIEGRLLALVLARDPERGRALVGIRQAGGVAVLWLPTVLLTPLQAEGAQ